MVFHCCDWFLATLPELCWFRGSLPASRLAADLFPCLLYQDLFVVVAVFQVWALGDSLTVDTGSVSAELKLSP